MMDEKEVLKILKEADHERVEGYMHMFDRVLLYTLAANIMPDEALKGTISLWDRVIKKTIDIDARKQTDFLEGTVMGRAAKFKRMPDGEEIRLRHLRQWTIAKSIIAGNLHQHQIDNDDGEPNFEPE